MPAVSVGAGLVAASIKPGVGSSCRRTSSGLCFSRSSPRSVPSACKCVEFPSISWPERSTRALTSSSPATSVRRTVASRTSRVCRRRRKESVHACSSTPRTQRASFNHLALSRESTTWWRRRTSISSVHVASRSCEPAGVAVTSCTRSRRRGVPPGRPTSTYFGGELSDLADGAARFDVSLAWHPWLGARESLSLLAGVATEKRERWSVGLAISPRTDSLPTGDRIVIPFRTRGREPSHAGSEARGSEREGGRPARGNPYLVPRLQHPGRRRSGCKRP